MGVTARTMSDGLGWHLRIVLAVWKELVLQKNGDVAKHGEMCRNAV